MSELTITHNGIAQTAKTGSDKKSGIVITPSITVSTDAYAANDLLFDKVELSNAVSVKGGVSKLTSVFMYNEDGVAAEDFLVLFFNNSTSIGVNANEAVSGITDAEFKASGFIGSCFLNGGETGYSVGNGRILSLPGNSDKGPNLPILVQAANNSTSIYVAVIVITDTPDYASASDGCKMTFGFEYLD